MRGRVAAGAVVFTGSYERHSGYQVTVVNSHSVVATGIDFLDHVCPEQGRRAWDRLVATSGNNTK